MKFVYTVLLTCVCASLSGQGPVITSPRGNARLNGIQTGASSKRALGDTAQLPFFDDFTKAGVYPDPAYWMDNQVYVNNHFSVSPPSYGVATFDNLDSKGRPWQSISGNTQSHSDSLTSNCINLKNYKNGLNTVNYTLADSIYLSFFYQTQGLGDPLDNTDSLVLKFKNGNGFWKTVWKASGTSLRSFKQVLVGVLNSEYLVPGFQFRFINFGKTTGNMNQWHLDYVRMNTGRHMYDTVINDVAINAVPEGPLQWYESMPYNHYTASPLFHRSPVHTVKLRNNFTGAVNVQYKCDVRNTYNQLIQAYPITSSARNVSGQSDTSEDYTPFIFDTLSGKQPRLHLKYTIAPLANDFLPSSYNGSYNNNEFTKTVAFNNYFAYDDGSAEGGYGLDYGSLPNGPGYAAIKFVTSTPDTLRGISVFFNRSVADVQFKAFSLVIWKQISEPPANNMGNDVILKKIDMGSTIYKDSINGFTDIIFDTSVYLPQGSFYIGWQQNTKFILNVGYDNNYKYAKTGGRNPNLFFNLNGYWEKVASTITGAVMMRPLLGAPIKTGNTSDLQAPLAASKTVLYPNPGNTLVHIESSVRITGLKLYNASGQLLHAHTDTDITEFNTEFLPQGLYTVEMKNEDGYTTIQKWIKIQ